MTQPFVAAESDPPLSQPERESLIDGLRGFALLGILVVNIQLLAHPVILVARFQVGWTADGMATWLVRTLFEGKFFLLFAFLFGYGFVLQAQSAERQQSTWGLRYARRISGLLLLGSLHILLLFSGDILHTYALLGILLWWLRKRPVRGLLRLAALLFVLHSLLWIFVLGPEIYSQAELPAFLQRLGEQAQAHYLGSFAQGVKQRLMEFALIGLFSIPFGWIEALVCMLLGMAAARRQLLQNWQTHWPRWRRYLPWCLGLGLLGNGLYASCSTSQAGWSMLLTGLYVFTAPLLSLSYAWLLMAVWQPSAWQQLLAQAGRISLSVYLLQSLLAGLIFYGYGLGYYAQLQPAALLGLALLLFLSQLLLSHVWLQRFSTGPFEWLLRKWTYLGRSGSSSC